MATTITYSVSVDFTSGIRVGQFYNEVLNSAITVTLDSVTKNLDNVNVNFPSAPTAGDIIILDGLVAAHVPSFPADPDNFEIKSLISSFPDAEALTLAASDTAGGMLISAGSGGIDIDSTNIISLDAGATSHFATSVGNLDFTAAGVLNVESNSGGINIGANTQAQTVNLGTGAVAKTLNIGNTTGATLVNVDTGTGGLIVDTASGGPISLDALGASSNFTLTGTADAQDLTVAVSGGWDASLVLSSTGTAADAIIMAATNAGGGIDIDTSTGGFRVDTSGQLYLASGAAAGGDITLDASSGGATISAGGFGIAINASGTGLVGIGHWSGGNVDIATAATARTVTIGNTTGATKLIQRFGTGGFIESQPAEESLADANVTVTTTMLVKRILRMTPTTTRTLTLDTPANLVSLVSMVDDGFTFSVINESGTQSLNVNPSTGATIGSNSIGTSSSGTFRVRFTNVTVSSEAYSLYRLA